MEQKYVKRLRHGAAAQVVRDSGGLLPVAGSSDTLLDNYSVPWLYRRDKYFSHFGLSNLLQDKKNSM